jgi:DNA repair photolyase
MISKTQKGRGAGLQLDNPFKKYHYSKEIPEGIDEWEEVNVQTSVFLEKPGKILSRNNSPDLPYDWSLNPYQGCEHGCIYCYARNSHNYWGFNAGIDFESKIVVKPNAAELLQKTFLSNTWKPAMVMLSGNTDCYQPLERRFGITRELLKVFLRFRNPVSIITKNALILRDLDLLREMSALRLVKVNFSITSLDPKLRRLMEPRTSSVQNKLRAISELSEAGIPTGILIGPVIPGLNDHEVPEIIEKAGEAGAGRAFYTALRLNGQLDILFQEWLERNFPERKAKILSQVSNMHGGKLNDSRWGKRMRGEGKWSEMIKQVFEVSRKRFIQNHNDFDFDLTNFKRNPNPGLFDSL